MLKLGGMLRVRAKPVDGTTADGSGEATRPLRPRRKLARLTVVLGAVVACVVGVPVALASSWLASKTAEAGKGAPSPAVAAMAYFHDAIGAAAAGEGPAYNLYCADDEALHEQATALVAAARRANIAGKRAFDRVEEAPGYDKADIRADRATYTTGAQWIYANVDPNRLPGQPFWWESAVQQWTFDMVNDGGWRVCKVTPPDPCAKESGFTCDWVPPPRTAPSYPAPRQWDTRVRWNCLPDAPAYFRPLDPQKCATPEDWVPPGPYECAPDYTLPRGPAAIEACRQLGWVVS